MLRSYRESSLQTYRANDDVVNGWIWHSGLGTRTCAACWAMHGTMHRLDERLDDHVRGRCTMVPITRSWEELGFKGIPDARVQVEPGTELFKRLPEGQQIDIIGQAAYAAYKSGAVKLEDFVGRRHDRRWGSMRYTKSLKDMVGSAEAAAWQKKALAERIHPIAGGGESTKERIERLIAEGRMPREAVDRAEQFWQEQLQHGVSLPNQQIVRVTLDDLYHLIVDPRIWRHPERIEWLLQGTFQIREADLERRRALSRWQEGDRQLFGYAILDPDNGVRTLHVTSESELRRQQRKGKQLWP